MGFSSSVIHHISKVVKNRYGNYMKCLPKDSLGLRVKVERVKRRLKQSELAALAGVTQTEVSQLELDKKVVPSRRKRILSSLGIREIHDYK